MNFSAYDIVDKAYYNGTWARESYKRLYSSKIEYHRYYAWLKRYDATTRINNFFLAVYDNDIYEDIISKQTGIDKHGNTKFELSSIWDEIKHHFNTELLIDISVTEVQRDTDGVIYAIEF
jgi:hypothetical protein